MPKTKVAEATTTAAGTTVAMIVAQAVVVAAIAVPVGLFAVALGMLAARGQTGQVRIAVTTSVPAPPPTKTPSPAPSPCEKSGTLSADGSTAVLACDVTPDLRWMPDAWEGISEQKPTCASTCKLYRLRGATAHDYGCTAWEITSWYEIGLFDVLLFPGGLVYEGLEQLLASNPYNSYGILDQPWQCAKTKPAGTGMKAWVLW